MKKRSKMTASFKLRKNHIFISFSNKLQITEVKTTLNQKLLAKVIEQLPEYQRFFSDWFAADVCAKWKIKKMAYFKKMEPGWQICENWKDFILHMWE